ncbi:MAG: alternative ribosome rescue aminoacyl-tRNA hydrolase ArfB [Patescibacteria group bacterium]|nr:alternative ribosome rescue aminoacyl-tRNA hydrolase ArfB [Patescibacteria group bacterium]
MGEFKSKIRIPEWEITFRADRASGPGGQNVNKTATKITLWFKVNDSKTLNSDQKKVVLKELSNWINKEGEIVISEQSSRSQWTNRKNAISRLNELINDGLIPEKQRGKTKVPKKEKEARLIEKKARSEVKKFRGKVALD